MMKMMHSIRQTWITIVSVALLGVAGPRAMAQVGSTASGSQYDLSETVQVDRADSTVSAQLERVKAYLADGQWEEAIATLEKVAEHSEGKLLAVTEQRYIDVGDYAQMQLARLPPEALKLYRRRLDPTARKWYEEGIARRDRQLLCNVVEQAFASRYGDKALLALGEMDLEAGHYAAARWHWERILPAKPAPGVANTWPGYPDSDLDPAMVRARLVLVSILEGAVAQAREELAEFVRLHPAARGRLGGREVVFADALAALLAESAVWPKPTVTPDWPTFAGSPRRDKIAPRSVDPRGVAWRIPLPNDGLEAAASGTAARKLLDAARVPSCYPLVLGDRIFLNDSREILAVRATDGRPAWGETSTAVYRDPMEGVAGTASIPTDALGTPRFTMTALDNRLFARMGSPLTGRPQQPSSATGNSYLVCLDLESEGKLLWKIAAEEGWAFEGSPVADAAGVYVAMRHDDIRPQAHVACFDPRTGRLRWRRLICSAETPARGLLAQCTHNLLTLRDETLYYNTNLGAVAAISAPRGRVRWVSLYPARTAWRHAAAGGALAARSDAVP